MPRNAETDNAHLQRLDRFDAATIPRALPVALTVVVITWGAFEVLATRLRDSAEDLDHQIVFLLRDPRDHAQMIGPRALEEVMRDFTALGGYAVLTVTIVAFAVFQRLQNGPSHCRFFLITTIGGYLCSMLMKKTVGRDRPAIVPHLSHVETSSFPSTHSMMSAITWLTIGVMLSQHSDHPAIRRLLTLLPLLLAFSVGISRVFMGVHFPTDVLAGWTAGLLWTWAAFAIWPRALR